MSRLLFLIISIFLTIAFFSSYSNSTGVNPFFLYALSEARFIVRYQLVSIIFLLGISVYLVRSYKIQKQYPFYKKYVFSVFHTLAVVFAGFFLTYFFLLLIAFLELNVFSIVINVNPKILGIITDRNTILKTIKTSRTPFEIATSDKDQKEILFAVGRATTGQNNLYGKVLLPSISGIFILPIHKPEGSMILIDNTLIFTEINNSDIQAVSPYIAYLFIQQYFPNRYIKHYPKVSIMSRERYNNFRLHDADSKLLKVVREIQSSDDSISSISAKIQSDTDLLTAQENALKDTYTQRETKYKACYSAGSYQNGVFQRLYVDSYCKNIYDTWSSTIDEADKKIEATKKDIAADQEKLKEAQQYTIYFKTQKNIVKIQGKNIPNELGVFTPNDSLEIALQTTNPHAIADYFETLTHEYLHYASYNKDKHLADPFFEEGLTEYFARKTIENSLNVTTNLGYPVQVKVITELLKSIPESDLADVYFTKDETNLEKILNQVYGDNFYKSTRTLLATLQFTSSPAQMLKIANTIMKKIGSPPLSETDLFSAYSNY